MTDDFSWPADGPQTGLGPGSVVAGYRLEERIGAGGMAVVFRAWDQRLGRPVALKVLAPQLAADAGFRARFVREWRAATAVEHPHIIPVYAADDADGVLYIAMRLIGGGDLGSIVTRQGPLDPRRALPLLSGVAAALDAAHAAGLVHRDVKPANILIDAHQGMAEHVYLSDFGISKGALTMTGLTATGHFVGTLDYAAPEQIAGQRLSGQADQYALACVAFTLLAGKPPFARDEPLAVLWAHRYDPPPPLSALRPGLPATADEALGRALAKDPAGRYPSCVAFTDALRAALAPAAETSPAASSLPADPADPPTEVPPAVISSPAAAEAAEPVAPGRPPTADDSPATRDVSGPVGMSGAGNQPAPLVPAYREPGTADAFAGPRRRKAAPRVVVSAAAALVVLAGAVTGTILLWPATARHSAAAGAAATNRSGARTGTAGSTTPSATASASATASLASSGPGLGASPVATFTTGGQDVTLLAFSPSGTLSAVDPKYDVSVFSVASKKRQGSFALGYAKIPSFIVPSWDGRQILDSPDCTYKGSPCRTLVFDTATRRQVGSLPPIAGGRTPGVSSSLFATDDSAQDGANLYDIASGARVGDLANPDHHFAITMALSPDGKVLAVSSDGTDAMYLWDTKAQKVIGTVHTGAKGLVQSAIFSGDGKTLAASDGVNSYVFDVGTRSLVATVRGAQDWGAGGNFSTVLSPDGTALTYTTALSPDGKLLAYLNVNKKENVTGVTLANARTGATIATVPAADAAGAESVAFSRDGSMLAVGHSGGEVSVWKVER